MVNDNSRLVHWMVRRRYNRWRSDEDYNDLVQEGMMGLLRAAELYDPDRGTTFAGYAGFWIVAFISAFLAKERRNKTPLSHDTPYGERKHLLRHSLQQVVAYDDDGEPLFLSDVLAEDKTPAPDSNMKLHDNARILFWAIDLAMEHYRDERIVDLAYRRYVENLTFAAISPSYGVTRQSVQLVDDKMLRHMKRSLGETAEQSGVDLSSLV